jgi:hypothetical protein
MLSLNRPLSAVRMPRTTLKLRNFAFFSATMSHLSNQCRSLTPSCAFGAEKT